MTDFSTPSSLGAEAEVRPAGMAKLYTPAGLGVFVAEADVPTFLAQGWKTTLLDPLNAARELAAAAQALIAPVEALAADVADGRLHPANFFAAAAAVQNVMGAWAALVPAFDDVRPEEVAGVTLKNSEGQMIVVDPGQVADYAAKGWTPE